MIDNRKLLVENVFKFTNKNNIYLPVNFKRIMKNLQHQLHIQKTSMWILPLEVYEIIDFSIIIKKFSN